MKTLLSMMCALAVLVPSFAILGLEYGPALSKFYGPHYMGPKKGMEAEKAMEMAHMHHGPHLVKEKFLGFGKGYPFFPPALAKEKEMGFETGKEMAMHNPYFAKEKKIADEIGKAKMHY